MPRLASITTFYNDDDDADADDVQCVVYTTVVYYIIGHRKTNEKHKIPMKLEYGLYIISVSTRNLIVTFIIAFNSDL